MTNWTPWLKQKRIATTNREEILTLLSEKEALTFTELQNESGFKKPTLSKHLRYLRKNNLVEKALENDIDQSIDRVIYRLTNDAYELPFLKRLRYLNGILTRIMVDLLEEGEEFSKHFTQKVRTISKTQSRLHLGYRVPTPEFIDSKSEINIIQTIEKWITPIIVYSVILELKTGYAWTEAIQSIVKRLTEIIQSKDLSEFENTVRNYYSQCLVQHFLFTISKEKISKENLPFQSTIPVIESLDNLLQEIELQERFDLESEKEWQSFFKKLKSVKGKLPLDQHSGAE